MFMRRVLNKINSCRCKQFDGSLRDIIVYVCYNECLDTFSRLYFRLLVNSY